MAEELNLSPNDKVLDLCCGQGGLTDYLGKAYLTIGIDTSTEAITAAQRTARKPENFIYDR